MIYDLSQIKDMAFEMRDVPELWQALSGDVQFKLTDAQKKNMPVAPDIDTLRTALATLFIKYLDGNYAKLEYRCNIKRDTFQRYLKYRNGRDITYISLSKFCIGAGVSTEEAKELFSYTGYALSSHNMCDYILLCILQNGDAIDEYAEAMKEHARIDVLT